MIWFQFLVATSLGGADVLDAVRSMIPHDQFEKEHPEWAKAKRSLWKHSSQVKRTDLSNYTENKPQVVVLATTYHKRRQFEQHILKGFEFQDYEGPKHLLVIDQKAPDDAPKSIFKDIAEKRDDIDLLVTEDVSAGVTGRKKNEGTIWVRNKFPNQEVIIVNFDDDDLYAPTYVSIMVKSFSLCLKCGVVEFGNWNFIRKKGNKTEIGHFQSFKREEIYGFGFVFAWKSTVTAEFGKLDNFGEDLVFIQNYLKTGKELMILDDSIEEDKMHVLKRVDLEGQGNLSDVPCWTASSCPRANVNIHKLYESQCSALPNAKECQEYYSKELLYMYPDENSKEQKKTEQKKTKQKKKKKKEKKL